MRWTLLALVGLALGCTEPVRDARDGSVVVPDCTATPEDEVCDSASAQNVMFAWANSVCDLLLNCCEERDRAATVALMVGEQNVTFLLAREPAMLEDHRACQRAVALSLFSRYQQSYQSRDDHRQRFDRDNARACLDRFELGATQCAPGLVLVSDEFLAEPCKHLFLPEVPEEGLCRADEDCLDAPDGGRSVCQNQSDLRDDGGIFFSLNGVCRPLPRLGEKCPLPDGDCGEDAFCGADRKCRARAHVDEPCVAAPCDAQTFCDTSKPLPQCALRRGFFGPCVTNAECQVDAQCDAQLSMCLPKVEPNPLDVEFDFCLGTGGVAVARPLVGDAGS